MVRRIRRRRRHYAFPKRTTERMDELLARGLPEGADTQPVLELASEVHAGMRELTASKVERLRVSDRVRIV